MADLFSRRYLARYGTKRRRILDTVKRVFRRG
jgi:hypothetical protein